MAPPSQAAAANNQQQSSHHQGHKRKRPGKMDKLKKYGLDLPDIPGLPVQVIPLHVHVLQATTKFFQQDETAKRTAIAPFQESSRITGNPSSEIPRNNNTFTEQGEQRTVMASILHRLDESTAEPTLEQARLAQELSRKKEDAVSSWLQAIHRCMRDQRGHDNNNDHKKGACVPLAAWKHVWAVGMEHKRVTVRRAALHCAGCLLQKSSDCRRYLLQEGSVLVDWMDVLAVASDATTAASAVNATRVRLWQREAYLVLKHLTDEGYDDLYPTLGVGFQRLRQMLPFVTEQQAVGSSETAVENTLADWRRLRDVALEYADQEEQRVHKLIQRAQVCMDVLVPRLGVNETLFHHDSDNKNHSRTNDEDDDEGIDWEDGWEDDNDAPDIDNIELHSAAVERTLAVIETTARLEDGQLEIDFDQHHQPTRDEHKEVGQAASILARARLLKCVSLLLNRHTPRLSLWVEGLSRSDALVLQRTEDGTASCFVTMPPVAARRRKDVLECLLELKSNVASILKMAQRLGIDESTTTAAATITDVDRPARQHQPPVAVNLASSTRHEALATSLRRPRRSPLDLSHLRSNRIQIKYRKT